MLDKKILYPGKKVGDFTDGSKLIFHYQTKLMDSEQTIIDDTRKPWPHGYGEPLELVLGKRFKLPIWETCLKSMWIGEVSSFLIPHTEIYEYPFLSKSLRDISKNKHHAGHSHDHDEHVSSCCGGMLAFAGTGFPEMDSLMQQPQQLLFTFELLDIIPSENYEPQSWQLDTEQKLDSVRRLKCDGNELIKTEKVAEAMDKYKEALGRVEGLLVMERPGDGDYEDLLRLKLPLLLNYALCQLKLTDYYGAIISLSEILEKDPTNEKGLYRRAKAYSMVYDWSLAKKDLEKLQELYPKQSELVSKELVLLEHARKEHELKEKNVFANVLK